VLLLAVVVPSHAYYPKIATYSYFDLVLHVTSLGQKDPLDFNSNSSTQQAGEE